MCSFEQEDGSVAYDVSVWLRWDDRELDVSGMIPSLTVAIAVDDLVTEESFEAFTTLYTIVYQAAEAEAVNLESTLALIPDELPGHQKDEAERFMVTVAGDTEPAAVYEAVAQLAPYHHYALAAAYAGEDVYRIAEAK